MRSGATLRAGVPRAATVRSRRSAVERVLATMRERYAERLSLAELAAEAFFSPYHFNRVFRHTTGVPPGRFLAALRMQRAKHLLVTTDLHVTSVCFEVGYVSLGTFTTHFRQLVGLGPLRLRRLADALGDVPLESLCRDEPAAPGDAATAKLLLQTQPDDPRAGVVFAGFFRTPLPQSRPAACTVATLPATPTIACADRGPHYTLVSAYERSADVREALLAGDDEVLVGVAGPLLLGKPKSTTAVHVPLRQLDVVDPPILLALPLVLAEQAETVKPRRAGRARAQARVGAR